MDQFRRDRAKAPALRTAFPTLQQLRIELKFDGPSPSAPTPQSHALYPPAAAFFEYPCPYWDCDGQFDLGSAVKAALAAATHRAEGVLECRGSRGGERTTRRPCQLRLVYEVTGTFEQRTDADVPQTGGDSSEAVRDGAPVQARALRYSIIR
jgi:hypothetical protein